MAANGVNGINGSGDVTSGGERVWDRPDRPSRCTWQLGKSKPSDSPHFHAKR